MKRPIIITMLLLICCSSFSQIKNLATTVVRTSPNPTIVKEAEIVFTNIKPKVIIGLKNIQQSSLVQVKFLPESSLGQVKFLPGHAQYIASLNELSTKPRVQLATTTTKSENVPLQITLSKPLGANAFEIKWLPIISIQKRIELPILNVKKTSLCPQKGLSEFKIHKDRLHPKDDLVNNDDCMDDPLSISDPNISPDAISVVTKENVFFINNKPTDNPSNDLVEILSKSEISTSVGIIFDNTDIYSSVLDLDKIEQNTNLDIEHCVTTYYSNGNVLVQIPIKSKSLFEGENEIEPKKGILEWFKHLFGRSTRNDNFKDKTNEIRTAKDLIESELNGIRYLENNIKNEHYDYFIEEETAA